MRRFKVEFGPHDGADKTIEAARFADEKSFTVFYSDAGEQLLAIPTARIFSIEAEVAK